jgi:hypothetical protein
LRCPRHLPLSLLRDVQARVGNGLVKAKRSAPHAGVRPAGQHWFCGRILAPLVALWFEGPAQASYRFPVPSGPDAVGCAGVDYRGFSGGGARAVEAGPLLTDRAASVTRCSAVCRPSLRGASSWSSLARGSAPAEATAWATSIALQHRQRRRPTRSSQRPGRILGRALARARESHSWSGLLHRSVAYAAVPTPDSSPPIRLGHTQGALRR